MYGGWYIACLRNGRTVALILGPTKTADKLPKIDKAKIEAMVKKTLHFEPWPDEQYEVVFFLSPVLQEGAANKEAWLNITKDEWHPQ